jgi:hypothetical protein
LFTVTQSPNLGINLPPAVEVVQEFPTKAFQANITSFTMTATITAVGNSILLAVTGPNQPSSVTDSLGTHYSWTQWASVSNTGQSIFIWLGTPQAGTPAGATTITVNIASSATATAAMAWEVSNLSSVEAVQTNTGNLASTGSGTNFASKSIVANVAGSVVFNWAALGNAEQAGPSGPWVVDASLQYFCSAYRPAANVAIETSYTAAWQQAVSTWSSISVVLQPNNPGAAPTPATPKVLTPTFANGSAAQLSDVSRDYMVYLTVTTAGTATTIAIGPTSTPANTIVPSSPMVAGTMYSMRLPAGWYLKWAGTTTAFATQTAISC